MKIFDKFLLWKKKYSILIIGENIGGNMKNFKLYEYISENLSEDQKFLVGYKIAEEVYSQGNNMVKCYKVMMFSLSFIISAFLFKALTTSVLLADPFYFIRNSHLGLSIYIAFISVIFSMSRVFIIDLVVSLFTQRIRKEKLTKIIKSCLEKEERLDVRFSGCFPTYLVSYYMPKFTLLYILLKASLKK